MMANGLRSSAGDSELCFKSVSLSCALEKTRVVGQNRSASHSRKGANLYDSIKLYYYKDIK
jgi:hypothetical protein